MKFARRAAPAALWLALGAALLPGDGAAQDVAGRWVMAVSLDAGSGEATFVLEVSGGEITGTYAGTLGEAPVKGTVEGTTVTFAFSVDQVGEVTYEGTVDGDTMRGSCVYGALGSGSFQGTRQPPG